ncbi:glycosyltransferase family 2 protein [Alteromonadaceae bacterium BrNp21-10]|nr:glycosyltransferase family 2 protein [Alteromonadaceae bacterium BrNp21-10]
MAICETLQRFNLPIIVVDDASNAECEDALRTLASTLHFTLIRHEVNQGKGGAVMTGIKQAAQLNYSHVLQVDADGQHNLSDIPALLSLAKQHSMNVISGLPQYDDSIPKGRKYGRYITHFWVWLETLSFSLKDTMCGFRVYPIAPCVALFAQRKLGKRMDFDIEILVRLYWQNITTIFLPTRVIYPEGGSSHFQPLGDNLRISWLHSRLFIEMLIRLPQLLIRKCLK